jgi:hypothetical protein
VAVHFNSNPPGAFIQVDGRSNSAWITPFTIADVSLGSHEVVLTKPGYKTEKRSLEIGPKSDAYTIELAPASPAVSVSSEPSGASIEIDGRVTGKVTPAQVTVSEGQHRIVVRKEGYNSAQVDANVKQGQIQNFPLLLTPLEARQPGNGNVVTRKLGEVTKLGRIFGGGSRAEKGVIDFVTNPPGAKIFIEGKAAKAATPAHAQFEPGDYEIELREPGFKPVTQTVHVEAGKTSRVNVVLDPQ